MLTFVSVHCIISKSADKTKVDTETWGLSSAGRASALQAEGHRFEPCRPHGILKLAKANFKYVGISDEILN